MGRYDEAEVLLLETLKSRRRVFGDHPDTLNSMYYLASLYDNQGRYDEAEPLHRKTLETRKRVLGDDHPDTLNSMYYLASLYDNQGRYDEAESLHRATLEARKRVLGDDHKDTLSSMQTLAGLYIRQGRPDEARPLAAGLLAIRKKAAEGSGADAAAKNSYAWELLTCEPADLRNPQEALTYAVEANDLTNHEVPNYLDTLALAYHLTGDTAKAIETVRRAITLLPEGADRSEYEKRLEEFESALKGEE
jgi:tetratricopeptide (TPR) repeat protein